MFLNREDLKGTLIAIKRFFSFPACLVFHSRHVPPLAVTFPQRCILLSAAPAEEPSSRHLAARKISFSSRPSLFALASVTSFAQFLFSASPCFPRLHRGK